MAAPKTPATNQKTPEQQAAELAAANSNASSLAVKPTTMPVVGAVPNQYLNPELNKAIQPKETPVTQDNGMITSPLATKPTTPINPVSSPILGNNLANTNEEFLYQYPEIPNLSDNKNILRDIGKSLTLPYRAVGEGIGQGVAAIQNKFRNISQKQDEFAKEQEKLLQLQEYSTTQPQMKVPQDVSFIATPPPATVTPATSATNNTSPLATSPAKVGQTNFGTGNTYQAPQLDANGRYIAPVAAAASTPLAQPMQPAYQQAPIQSNVLQDRQANEKMQKMIASNNSLQQQDMTIGANRINAKYAHQQNQDLMNFDINGHQKPQLEQQAEGQKDLSQRRSENQKGWEALLGNDLANKKLTQVDAAQAYQNEQYNQTKAQQESQYARTLAAAPKAQNWKPSVLKTYNDAGQITGETEGRPYNTATNEYGATPEERKTQQKDQSAQIAALQKVANKTTDTAKKAAIKQYLAAMGVN